MSQKSKTFLVVFAKNNPSKNLRKYLHNEGFITTDENKRFFYHGDIDFISDRDSLKAFKKVEPIHVFTCENLKDFN